MNTDESPSRAPDEPRITASQRIKQVRRFLQATNPDRQRKKRIAAQLGITVKSFKKQQKKIRRIERLERMTAAV